jgi:hypothetical protein
MTALRMPRRPYFPETEGGDETIPYRLERMEEGARLFVRAFRHYVAGATNTHDGPNDAWNEIAATLGGGPGGGGPGVGGPGKPVMGALILLVERIRAGAGRRIHHHARCCPCLAPDEARLLALIGTAAGGRMDHAEALAADFLGRAPDRAQMVPDDALAVAESARALGLALHGAGHPVGRLSLFGLKLSGRGESMGGGPVN